MKLRSPSLIAALKAAERVLNADTGDLRQLAEIAGVDPETLYLKADLSGVDLRSQDIEYLLPLQVTYSGAKLTDYQTRQFRRAEREAKRTRVKQSVHDERVELVLAFIAKHAGSTLAKNRINDADTISNEALEKVLLEAVFSLNGFKVEISSEYMNAALTWAVSSVDGKEIGFFRGLFELLGQLECSVDARTVQILRDKKWTAFGDTLGDFIGAFRATKELDVEWLSNVFWSDGPELEGILFAAEQLGQHRPVHTYAIEWALSSPDVGEQWSWDEMLTFIAAVPFECSADEAERIATYLVVKDWDAVHTRRILEARTHARVQTALFRQLLGQGRQKRVAEIVKWLERDQGAAGALSLENAFNHIRDFTVANSLAQSIASRLSDFQLLVIANALDRTASNQSETDAAKAFRRRYL